MIFLGPIFFHKAGKDSLRAQALKPLTRASPGVSLDIAFASLSHQLKGADLELLILQVDGGEIMKEVVPRQVVGK